MCRAKKRQLNACATAFRIFPLPVSTFSTVALGPVFFYLCNVFSLSLSISIFRSPVLPYFSLFFLVSSSFFQLFFVSFTNACAARKMIRTKCALRNERSALRTTVSHGGGLFHRRVIRLELYVSGVPDLILTIAFATRARQWRLYFKH